MAKIFWIVTYGNLGLEVSHFTKQSQFKKALKEAEKMHRYDIIDTYMDGETEIELTMTIVSP